ncbi:hypothetical protein DOC35_19425 [Salmonella enterica subsp. enterica]|nr:hypothetical protein [Salmonella enterica subsp. enterica]
MAKKQKTPKAPGLTQAEAAARKEAKRKAARQSRAQKALKLVQLAKAQGIPLTAGAALRMLERQDNKSRRRRCPPSPIRGSMELMQMHITAPRGWIVYGSTTGHVIPRK